MPTFLQKEMEAIIYPVGIIPPMGSNVIDIRPALDPIICRDCGQPCESPGYCEACIDEADLRNEETR